MIYGGKKWDKLLKLTHKSYYANDRDDLSKKMSAIEELENIGKSIK